MAFFSRYLTASERSWSEPERLVSLTAWGLRRFARYALWVPGVKVVVPWPAELALVLEKGTQTRLRAFMIE